MEEITSLQIRYLGNKNWEFIDNTSPLPNMWNAYNGGFIGQYFTVTTKSGGILYNRVPWTAITYVDTITPSNSFTPTSPTQLEIYLDSVGFFDESNTGGGSGGVTLFPQLGDVPPSYLGQNGKFLVVNEDQMRLEYKALNVPVKIGDLSDVQTNMVPNSVLKSNGAGTAATWVALSSLTQPYYPFKTSWLKSKGYTYQTIDGVLQQRSNTQNLEQVGDIFEGWFSIDADPEPVTAKWIYIKTARWIGGDRRVANNFVYAQSEIMPFNSDPDFNS